MTEVVPYTFVVLRYRHDPVTSEFVNVGVVVHCASCRFVKIRLASKFGRVSAMFPHLDKVALRGALTNVRTMFRRIAESPHTDFGTQMTAEEIARTAVPPDDSALQWANAGAGLTANLDVTLEHLFDRMVTRYDQEAYDRRTDHDVWRTLRAKLEERKIVARFHEKVIKSDIDRIDFKLAWKNGAWNCIQPLSFDLADGDGIRDKARRWTGNLLAVAKTSEPFKPYFVVAKPSQTNLFADFESALAILRTSPVVPEIYQEDQAGQLAESLADEINRHDRESRT